MPSRNSKKWKFGDQTSYHDRVDLPNDFEVVHHSIPQTKFSVDSQRSPQRGRTTWTYGKEWEPEDNADYALDLNSDYYDVAVEAPVTTEHTDHVPQKKKYKRSQRSIRPKVVFKEQYRSIYLDELVRAEGRGDFMREKTCPDCLSQAAKIPGCAEVRCVDCFLPDLVCKECCRRRHRRLPFHTLECWTGSSFEKFTLKEIGLTIQLGHNSMSCPSPQPCHKNMRILHTNGIHDVSVLFCNCERALPHYIQLLRRGLYPATQKSIRTCATFVLLRHLHLLSLTTKGSAYDLYRMLERSTCNTGLNIPKSRYPALMRMQLQWRHLKMLKRGGRTHDPAGVENTGEGEIAVLCPSCPHPGINLPANWREVPQTDRFLYQVFVCIDANFRLKNQLVSSYSVDPGLGIGMAYMVPRKEYETYVLSKASDTDVSTCVGFSALAKANTKFSRGLRYTGVGAVTCGRSEMVLPTAIGNLQKGERYSNMDFVFVLALRHFFDLETALVSYDIACQWFIHLHKRLGEVPKHLQIPSSLQLRPAIPKMHEHMHEKAGHEVFSLNLIEGAGLGDGECLERVWAGQGSLGNSTKTQGPGSRQDTIDDNIGFWNWEKYISMGKTLMRRYKEAIKERNLQVEGHRGLTNSISKNLVKEWENMCIKWDNDTFPKSAPNPYETDDRCLSESQVRKELAEQEKQRINDGDEILLTMTPSMFLITGLELEDTQRRIGRLSKKHNVDSITLRQGASVEEQRNSLRIKLRQWEQLRSAYMPGLSHYRLQFLEKHDVARATDKPEDEDLCLPSSITKNHRDSVCMKGLAEIEEKLRMAQSYDALDGLRHVLRIKTRMVHFKNKNIRGQRDGTRSRAVIDRVHERARYFADKYRTARDALMNLLGPGDWETSLRPLHDNDIRAYTDPVHLKPRLGCRGTVEDNIDELPTSGLLQSDEQPGTTFSLLPQPRDCRDGTGETRRTLSWIWLNTTLKPDDAKDDIFRSEWAKSRARSRRAIEEVKLLHEEMRRVLEFLRWRTKWWEERQYLRSVANDAALEEGIRAYARTQADLQSQLSLAFRALWKYPLQDAAASNQAFDNNDNDGDRAYDHELDDEKAGSEICDADTDDDDDDDIDSGDEEDDWQCYNMTQDDAMDEDF